MNISLPPIFIISSIAIPLSTTALSLWVGAFGYRNMPLGWTLAFAFALILAFAGFFALAAGTSESRIRRLIYVLTSFFTTGVGCIVGNTLKDARTAMLPEQLISGWITGSALFAALLGTLGGAAIGIGSGVLVKNLINANVSSNYAYLLSFIAATLSIGSGIGLLLISHHPLMLFLLPVVGITLPIVVTKFLSI